MRLILVLLVFSVLPAIQLPADDFVTGRALQQALDKPLGSTWVGLSRRDVLGRIAEARKLAVVLDRRIDPSAEVTVESSARPLRELFQAVLPSGGEPRVVGETVYLGPEPGVRRLRTVVALRTDELRQTAASGGRQLDLVRRKTIAWQDLATPLEVLQQIGEAWELSIEDQGQVPHDLWAGATLHDVNTAEALSLVLIQFDLTFDWAKDGNGVTLKPLPARVVVEQRHRPPPGTSAEQAVTQWKEAWPGIETRLENKDVVVLATVEEHEALQGRVRPRGQAPAATNLKPLKLVRIERLRFENPARALLDALSKNADVQLDFEYDEDQLKAAGIDLDQRIKFEVKKATVEELLHAAFDPLKIHFTIEDRTVRLTPDVTP